MLRTFSFYIYPLRPKMKNFSLYLLYFFKLCYFPAVAALQISDWYFPVSLRASLPKLHLNHYSLAQLSVDKCRGYITRQICICKRLQRILKLWNHPYYSMSILFLDTVRCRCRLFKINIFRCPSEYGPQLTSLNIWIIEKVQICIFRLLWN